ncbi:MAG: hypothetical protein RMK20_05020, partial [Verrucomicrobiales bacterium]|nr:hypothetical protein [Verrucomicrobiales bacterium]
MALGQTAWKGTVNTAWTNAANWTAGVPTAAMDAILGDTNFTGSYQPTVNGNGVCKSLVVGGARATTLTINRALTVQGDVLIATNGVINHSAAVTISVGGNWTNRGSYTTARTGCTIAFAGSTQYLSGATAFRRLTINAGSTTFLATNITVTNALTVNGTLDPGDAPTWTIAGPGTLTVGNGGRLRVKAATFAGNYALTGTITLNSGSTVDYAANTNQTIANTLTYRTLQISGGGVKSLAGNLPNLNAASATEGNVYVDAGTLDLGTFTANRATTTAGGTFAVASGAVLRIGGTNSFPANYATYSLNPNSSVEYSGTNQTVAARTYGHLILSSSGTATKTLPTSAFTVLGNFLMRTNAPGAAVTANANAGLSVAGHLTLGPGTTFNAGSAPLTFAGNWTNHGNFQGGSSTVTFAGTDSTLAGGGVTSFHHLTVSNGNVVVLPDTSLTVSGNLVSSETASFQHLPGAGSVTLTGAGRLLQGNGFSFNNLVVSGSVTASGSFTVAGHLRVDGSLVASGGTLTLSGNAKSIFGSGTLALHALNVPGTITTTNNFSLSGDLSVGGSFTATAGTVTFTGITRLSGTASLFNGTLNGTLLQMTPGSVFRMYGAATLLAGTFDAQSMTPNTVVYCSAAPQTIVPVTYHNLEIAPGGPRLLIGPVTVTGDLTVQSGALLQGGTNAHTLVLHGDWRNEGTFQAGNSAVELAGARSALLSGTNTFHQLRVNKADAGLAVRLAHPQTVATLEMIRGWMDTLTNTLTLTSNRTGDGVIWGTITRAHAFTAGTPYAFESPYTSVRFDTPGGITAVTVRATRQPPADFPFAASINREYEIHLTGTGPYSATLRLHYQPEDLNGNDESALRLWRNASGTWLPSGRTAGDTLARWVEQSGVTNLLGRWTLSDDNNAVAWNGQLSSAWEHPDNWTVLQGSPSRPPSTNDIVQLGGFAFGHQPVISTPVAVGSLSFGSAQPVTLTLNPGGSLTTLGNLGGVWTNPAAHTIAIGAQSLTVGGNLILSDGSPGRAIHLTATTGNVSVAGSLTTAGDASVTFTGPGTLRIGGDFNHLGGTFSPATSTVLYDGATDQNVAGLGYHRLGFEKDGGTARLDSSATVAGELHLARGGTFLLNAPLTVAGNVHIGSGTTLSAIGGPMHVAGSWTNEGVFLPGNGTVIFNGPADQTIQASTFHHLIVNKTSGIARLAGNLAINGDLTVSAGTLDLGGFSADRTSLGGTLDLAGGTLLRVGAAFPARFAVLNLAPTSTVRYEGAGPQTLRALSYGHLVLANGGGNPKALEGSTVVTGDLILQSNATLSAGPYLLELRGNWTNRGVFQPGTGLLKLGGTAKFFSGSTELQHLSVTGSYTVDGADLTIRGDLTVAGNLDAGSGQMSLDGNLQVSGVLSSRGNLSFTGSRVQTIQLPGTLLLSSNSLVSFNGTVAPAMAFSGGLNFGAVQINNTAGIAPAGDWTVHGTFTVASNAAFHGGAGTHLFRAAFLNHGTVTSSGTLGFEPAADAVIQLAGVTFQSSGLVRFAGSTAITLTGNPAAFKDVVIANTHPTGVTPATNWTVAGNLTLQPATTLRAGSGTHSLAGDLRVDGRLDGQTSSILLSGNSQVGGLGSTEFHHLTVLGVVSLLSDCSVSGNFTNHGSFDGSDFAVAFVGTNNAVLAGTNAPALDLVLVQKNSAALALARNLTVGSALTLAGGTLDTGPFVLAQETAGGTLSVGAGATLKLGGTNSMPVFDVITLDPASTVEYAGSGSQLIAALNYGNLASSSTGARTLASTGTIGIAGTFTPGPNSYTVTGSTVLFNGAGAQTIPAFNYFNLASSSTGARTLAPAGTIGVAGTFTPGPNSYTVTGSTVLFNGAGAQTIPAFTYGHLAIGGSGTKTLAGPATVRGNFSLLTGVFNDGGHPLVVQGHLTTAATHTGTGRIV